MRFRPSTGAVMTAVLTIPFILLIWAMCLSMIADMLEACR